MLSRNALMVVVLLLSITMAITRTAGQQTTVSTPVTTGDCAGAQQYVDEFLVVVGRLDTSLTDAGLDLDEFDSWISSDFETAAGFFETAVVELRALNTPAAAAPANDDYIKNLGLLSQLLRSIQTGGIFAAVAYTDPIDEATASLEVTTLTFEETCGVALFDHDSDGEPEIGLGSTGAPVTAATPILDSGTPLPALVTPIAGDATGTRDNPISAGVPVQVDDAWQVTVISVQPDAGALVQAENQFNEPPVAGEQFFIAQVSVTYNGTTSDSFYVGDLSALGPSSVAYTPYSDDCGVVPDEVPSNEMFPGGTVTGNVCWSVATSDVGSLVMYYEPADRDERVFLSLVPPSGVAVPVATPVSLGSDSV